jgi:hypothetical protein
MGLQLEMAVEPDNLVGVLALFRHVVMMGCRPVLQVGGGGPPAMVMPQVLVPVVPALVMPLLSVALHVLVNVPTEIAYP